MGENFSASISGLIGLLGVTAISLVPVSAALWLGHALVRRRAPKSPIAVESLGAMLIAATPFVFLGAAVGMMTGLSRVGVVGQVLPAILSVLGGIAAFLVSREGKAAEIALCTILAFSISVVAGISFGSSAREQASVRASSFATRKQEIVRELNLEQYRQWQMEKMSSDSDVEGADAPTNADPVR